MGMVVRGGLMGRSEVMKWVTGGERGRDGVEGMGVVMEVRVWVRLVLMGGWTGIGKGEGWDGWDGNGVNI
jgi:hypothetical protein